MNYFEKTEMLFEEMPWRAVLINDKWSFQNKNNEIFNLDLLKEAKYQKWLRHDYFKNRPFMTLNWNVREFVNCNNSREYSNSPVFFKYWARVCALRHAACYQLVKEAELCSAVNMDEMKPKEASKYHRHVESESMKFASDYVDSLMNNKSFNG